MRVHRACNILGVSQVEQRLIVVFKSLKGIPRVRIFEDV